jgi:glycosyltransferase 2 family protein
VVGPIPKPPPVGHDEDMEERASRASALWDHIVHPARRPHGVRLAVATVILVLTALPVERNRISDFELDVFRFFNELPGALEPFLTAVMQLGGLLAVPAAALVAALVVRRVRRGADLFLAGTLAWFVARLIKEAVERGRPSALLTDVVLRGETAAGFGFVSGHSAVAAALATVASFYLPMRGKVAVWTLAVLVGIARMYVGVHLPLDVAGGLAMGWAIGSLVHFVLLPELTGTTEGEGDA